MKYLIFGTLFLACAILFQNCSPASTTSSLSALALGTPSAVATPSANGIPWSTLGVVADGTTDNTAALNAVALYASQHNLPISGDCPLGKAIVLTQQWVWQSNMNIVIQPGCQIQSTLDGAGKGSFAISQSDLTTPLTNVSVDGLQISSPYVSADKIMELYVNNFTLTHWKVLQSGGVFFLRGSNQEIAYGSAINTVAQPGNPGVRHIGNCLDGYCTQQRDSNGNPQTCPVTPCPEVPTTGGKPANVYIHDNSMITGDAVYQACQPLATHLWTNVGSTEILYENDTGQSLATAFMLVGESVPDLKGFTSWSCSNITFDSVNENSLDFANGTASRWGLYLSSGAATNPYKNITVKNSIIGNNAGSQGLGVVLINAVGGGPVSYLNFENVTFQNVNQVAVQTYGPVSYLTIDKSMITAPQTTGSAVIALSEDTTSSNITNCTIKTNGNDGIQVGATDTFNNPLSGGSGAGNPASFITISGNTITSIGNGLSGIRLESVQSGAISQNKISSLPGATSSRGISFMAATSTNAGTTATTASANDLTQILGSPTIQFAAGQGNLASGNSGSPDYP